jgi:hypothetical protein
MRRIGILLIVTTPLIAVGTTLAQRGAASKIAGEYNFYGSSAGHAMRSARDYAGYYRSYAQTAQPVNPEVAQEAADAIGAYIVKAQKHMAWMRRQAQATNDKETLASLDVIDKHLADAARSHHEMHDTCLKASVEAAGTMKCCQVIDESLSKAIAEHDKLMKHLAGAKAPSAAK